MQRYNLFFNNKSINLHNLFFMMSMKRLIVLISVVWMMFSLAGCGNDQPNYKKKLDVNVGPMPAMEFSRYEDVLFAIDTADFKQELIAIQKDFPVFLDGDLENPDAVRYIKDFATDPMSITLYQKVKQAYPNLDEVRTIVGEVYRHFNYYFPEITLPDKIFTCVSGVDPYMPSVIFDKNAMVISLDWYLDGDEVYDFFGMPQYRSQRTGLPTLARDLGVTLCEHCFQDGHRQGNLLEEMVLQGVRDYCVEALYPTITDEVLLGYTSSQLQWARTYEGDLWADMVGNQILYSTDLLAYRTYLADGPFTNEYSHEAPPRLGEYLGLQIVRSYMNNHDCTLRELMQNNDLQGLFQDSKYKPKK